MNSLILQCGVSLSRMETELYGAPECDETAVKLPSFQSLKSSLYHSRLQRFSILHASNTRSDWLLTDLHTTYLALYNNFHLYSVAIWMCIHLYWHLNPPIFLAGYISSIPTLSTSHFVNSDLVNVDKVGIDKVGIYSLIWGIVLVS